MADRRSKVFDVPVNPAIMPGLIMVADTVTLDDGIVLTVEFPAKAIISIIASSFDDVDTEKIVSTGSVSSNDLATVTFTATSGGSDVKFSYIILASITEVIAANVVTATTTETPVQ